MALSGELAGVETAAKILLYDLETAPLLAHIWSPWDKFVTHERLVHDSFILTWAAKWLGDDEVLYDALTGEEAIEQNDSRIVDNLAEMIREADIVVAHNGDKFDVPMLNNRLLKHGLEPIPPVRSIDTCQLSKRNFRLAYNKLDYLGEFLGVGKKIKTDWSLWERAYHGDEEGIAEMTDYNIQDVVLLENVFDRLVPYVRNFPRLVNAAYEGEEKCPYCGSYDLQRRGYHQTNVSNFQRFQCKTCKRYSRQRKSEPDKLALTTL
jgi:hypothetical protein